MADKTPTIVRAAELAKILGRHKNTVLNWANQALIPCDRRNQRVLLFDVEAVRAAMAKNGLNAG